MRQLKNVFLTHREVSGQEAAYRALSFPPQKNLQQVVFVNTSMPKDRVKILNPKGKLLQLDKSSTEVFKDGVVECYAAQPQELSEVSLAEFPSWYTLKTK